jgi:tungstate transport system substrate-binding protein
MRRAALLLALLAGACGGSGTGSRVLVGATHTLEDSGLLDSLLVAWQAGNPDLSLQIVVAGSGEILEYGRRRDVDALVTHAPAEERKFLGDGFGLDRRPVMWNEFVLLAPPDDPAGVVGASSVVQAFARIARSGAPFISRADESGTNLRELAIWDSAGTRPAGAAYTEAGTGMADALRVASVQHAYILSDIATFTVIEPELKLVIACRGDPLLLNLYSVMRVAGARNPDGAIRFADWITGPAAKAVIDRFGTGGGRPPLFHAGPPPPPPATQQPDSSR